jgi:hypothetical protein
MSQRGQGAGGVGQGQVGASQLEQRLHGHDRKGVGEQWAQPGRPHHQVSGLGHLAMMGGDACCPRVDEGAGPVVVELAVAHQGEGVGGEPGGTGPVVAGPGDDPSLGHEEWDEGRHTPGGGLVLGLGES